MQLLFTLLQTATDGADTVKKAATAAAETGNTSAPILEIMTKGGAVMIVLALALLFAIFFAIERLIYINKRTKIDPNLLNVVKDNLAQGKTESALTYCERTNTTQAQVVATGLRFLGSNMREIESAMETRANVELSAMESHLSYLSLIARIAPMLGFVGTIWGVINIFYSISVDSNLSIGAISGGLYTKMVTSLAGLLVGIIAFVMYSLLLKRIDRFGERIQEQSLSFLEMLNKSNL
jgi:biopolymer transport protein ExbB